MVKFASTVLTRLYAKVEADPTTGCHNWMGTRADNGYGIIRDGRRRTLRTHRVAYEVSRGPIPDGLHLDHLCRNRACCNPDHLEAVTKRVNTLRGVGPTAQNAAKTHCNWGHEFTPENTRQRKGGRECLACKHARSLARSRGGRAPKVNGEIP